MNVAGLQHELEKLSPQDGLRLVSDRYGAKAKFSSALGMEDQVITYWISHGLSIDIFTLDTGRLFQESYDLLDMTQRKYRKTINVFFPDAEHVEAMVSKKGPNSFYESVENRKECCFLRKVEPLRRALRGAEVWITGVRAEQSPNRQQMSLVEWDADHQLIKYNPIIHWTLADVEAYIKKQGIPVNSLHKKGFPSIGCAPCTRAIMQGEDIRAGRWWWENSSKECGLHDSKS